MRADERRRQLDQKVDVEPKILMDTDTFLTGYEAPLGVERTALV
ncbi:hypothetical protein [Mesorhizobium sp. M0139]